MSQPSQAPDSPSDRESSGLTLGHVLRAVGAEYMPQIDISDMHLIRHSFNPGDHEGLSGPEDLTPERVLGYTRAQDISTRRFPAAPPRYWLTFIADGQRRARLFAVYENRGEVLAERTTTERYFDLIPSQFLTTLSDRLVIDWTSPRSWHRRAVTAANLPVLEIADRDRVPFPGFDNVLLTHHELRQVVDDHRFSDWRVALSQVQGIYLITDSTTGRHYVGKADGGERILGRWSAYARDGHGGNVALRELAFQPQDSGASSGVRTDHARHFLFSLLRVFGPSTSSSEVNAAESHFKRALLSREFGLNRNG